jgi:antitoxin VapB
MKFAKVFRLGSYQAVQLPKEFRFETEEVEVLRRGRDIVLRESLPGLRRAFELLASLPEDVCASGRVDSPPQKRRSWCRRAP